LLSILVACSTRVLLMFVSLA